MSVVSDTFRFRFCSDKEADFALAMRLGFGKQKATHYAVTKTHGMTLYWIKADGSLELPYAMEIDAVIPFVWNWLKNASYSEEPDMDGSVNKGYDIFNEQWGHVNKQYEAIMAIRPTWIEYGK